MIELLIVDDEPIIREAITRLFEEDKKFHTTSVQSAKEAFRKMAEYQFDAIISDYKMPEMNGIAFLKQVRILYPSIPFIILTGQGEEKVVIEALNNGADYYVEKSGDFKAKFASLIKQIKILVENQRNIIKIKETNNTLNAIIDFLPDATLVADKDGKICQWNKKAEQFFGLTKQNVKGACAKETISSLYPNEHPVLTSYILSGDLSTIGSDYDNYLINGDTIEVKTSISQNSEEKFIRAICAPLYDTSGAMTGVIETIHDITHDKKMENLLRENEKKFRMIFNGVSDAIVLFEFNNGHLDKLIEVNDATLEMLEYTREEFIAKNHRDFIDENCDSDFQYINDQFRATNKAQFEMIYLSKNNKKIYCDNKAKLITVRGKPAVILVARIINSFGV